MSETANNTQKQKTRFIWWFIGIIILVIALGMLMPAYMSMKGVVPYRLVCQSSLTKLGKLMLIYAGDYDEKYPPADKWCDLLIEFGAINKPADIVEKDFRCHGNKEERCSYAVNQNCEPNSPPDVVLLFETKGGWNQSGGLELLTADNHGGKGCNIVFVDNHVEFVKKEDFSKLNWGQ